jgi:2-oxoglutarate dehydrogenase E1 component
MDRFSFLNAAHSQLIEDLYQQYLKFPDSLEPSWKAFFQGFDFALENYGDDDNIQFIQASASAAPAVQQISQAVSNGEVPEHIKKEFKVVNLIEAYRTRGHLFTKQTLLEKEDTILRL